ncbi:MAG: hypothetical protein JXA52_03935 [Planctomycetes bacterium]|nr:hypothetical protein [Planctomycetota bacterium]
MARNLVLENGKVKFVFSSTGNLKSITDLKKNETVACKGANNPLWQLLFRDKKGKIKHVPATKAQLLDAALSPQNKLVMTWDLKTLKTKVKATVQLDDTAIASWTVEVKNKSGMSLWEVQYPMIGGLQPFEGKGENDKLVVPWQYGLEIDNPVDFIKQGGASAIDWITDFGQCDTDEGVNKVAFSYPGMWSLQMMAFYNAKKTGIYFAAYDSQARFKRFGMYQDSKTSVSMVMTNYPDERIKANLDYKSPYAVKVGLFSGKWYDASKIYREWALQQRWCSKGTTRSRKDIPKWLKDTDFWYWNWRDQCRYGTPTPMAKIMTALKKKLGCNMALHWYGSHCEPFNMTMPEIFPISESKAMKLKASLEIMHRQNIHAIPYINPRMCDSETETWKKYNVKELVCLTETGEIHREEYGSQLPWNTICPTQKKWHKVILDIVKECMDHKYDGVYLDQVSSCYAVPCFNKKHGHPLGGGNGWYRGNEQMMELIQKYAKKRNKDSCFTSESTVECFNHVFDANLARMATNVSANLLGSKNAFPIPLCNSIYHDYIITYGSVTYFDRGVPAEQVYLEGALNLVSGNQLCFEGYTIYHIKNKAVDHFLDYYRTLCQYRKKYRAYFNLGVWENPVEIKTKSVETLVNKNGKKKMVPAVFTVSWKMKKTLHTFVNHTTKPQKIEFKLKGKQRKLTIPPLDVVGIEVK